jgi:hypothetical protein
MLKTGFVGSITEKVLSCIRRHPDFELTGVYDPGTPHSVDSEIMGLPLLSSGSLLSMNDVLVMEHAGPGMAAIIAGAIRRSMHILLLDTLGMCSVPVAELLKLQREAKTIIKIHRKETMNPALQACRQMLDTPCLVEIKLMIPPVKKSSLQRSDAVTILKMLDVLMYVCPLNIQKTQVLRHPFPESSGQLISARIEFDNGSAGNILFTEITDHETFTIDIYQKNMLLKTDMLDQVLERIEISGKDETPGQFLQEFNNNSAERIFHTELDDFSAAIKKNKTSTDLFELSGLLDLSRSILARSGCPG